MYGYIPVYMHDTFRPNPAPQFEASPGPTRSIRPTTHLSGQIRHVYLVGQNSAPRLVREAAKVARGLRGSVVFIYLYREVTPTSGGRVAAALVGALSGGTVRVVLYPGSPAPAPTRD